MTSEYVEQRDGGYFIRDTRVSLDSVVCAFLRGESPEGIVKSFPTLGLEQVFGALAFYLANREVVDRYLREGQSEFEALREQARRDNPALCRKLAEARGVARAPRVATARIDEVIEFADHNVLDIVRSRSVEQDVLDLLGEPPTR